MPTLYDLSLLYSKHLFADDNLSEPFGYKVLHTKALPRIIYFESFLWEFVVFLLI